MKKVLVCITMAALVAATTIGCGAEEESITAIEEVQEVETETVNEENTEATVEEEDSEESTEDVLEDGVITHLIEVANNPATTNMDEGVSYMFNKDEAGNRTLGSVIAYYSGISYDSATDNESFCKAFIDDYTPEIADKWDSAEIHDESNMYGVVISLDECDVTLMPDGDFEGMTVFLSTK